MKTLITLMSSLSLCGALTACNGEFANTLQQEISKDANQNTASSTQSAKKPVVTNDTIIKGLKAALEKGVGVAIKQLGSSGGFNLNPKVKIPVPEELQPITKLLTKYKQQALVDNFVNTMNESAEKAVPEVSKILVSSIKSMSLADGRKILQGQQDEATQYFKTNQHLALKQAVLPIIKQATAKAGVTSAYQAMTGKVLQVMPMMQQMAPDLNDYVAEKALSGLYLVMAEQEKKIRENPVERTTELLQDVFGLLNK